MKRFSFVSLVVGALLVLAGSLKAAPLDSRIPKDAVVYVGWQGADALAPQFAESNLKGLIDNTKVGDYIKENWPKWMATAQPDDPNAAKEVEEGMAGLKILWRHPMALYVGPMTFENPEKPGFKVAWLIDAGTDAPALEALYKKMLEKSPAPEEAKLALTVDNNVVIITLGDAKPEMFVSGEKAARIGGAPAYVAATKSMRQDAALSMYVDVHQILTNFTDGLAKSPDAPAEIKEKVPACLEALGLTSLTQFAYAGGFDKKQWVEEMFMGIKGPKVGLLSLLDVKPLSDEALHSIPKDAVAFNAGKVDLTKLLAEVRKIIKQVSPENADDFETALTQAGGFAGIDLAKDFIAPLGDEWVFYRGPRTEEMASHPFVLVHKLRDSATFEKTLATLADKVNEMAQGKVVIEKLDTGTMTVTGVRLPYITIAWTVRGDYLYVSNLDGISGAIDQVEKKGPSIMENPDFKALIASLPAKKPIALTYSEPAKLYPDMYHLIMTYLPMARLVGLDIPGDLIPTPKRIAPFLTPGGGISWIDGEGFHYSSRTAFPGASLFSGQPSGASVGALAMGTSFAMYNTTRAEVMNH